MTVEPVSVGIVGSGYIAGVHSAAYRTVAGTYPDAARDVRLQACADVDLAAAGRLATAWGWQRSHADWREVTRADDVDVVDICVPNVLHPDIACDALAHGKHVICEKPLATTSHEARAMAVAAAEARLVAQVCFYYRVWPAISWAKQLLDSGELGSVRHYRGWIFQDYAASPHHDLGWRARLEESGAGAVGDLGSHIVDLSRYLCGEISAVSASMREIVDRTVPTPGVDDVVSMLVDFSSGVGGTIEASWALRGKRCDLGFDVVCDRGALRFSWERSNELGVLAGDVTDPTNGYRTVLIGDGQPDVSHFVSVPGQGMGYRDTFTIGVSRALRAIARGESSAAPTFEDGLAVALVVDAIKQSAVERTWVDVPSVVDAMAGT